MFALRYSAVIILIAGVALGFFVWHTTGGGGHFDFKLGLDLSGGSELTYAADISKVPAAEVADDLATLQTVIERRVNPNGVGESSVQVEQGGVLGGGQYRLIIDLPGVGVDEAIQRIGSTPTLEFKLVKAGYESKLTLPATSTGATAGSTVPNPDAFTDSGLTGKYLTSAALVFSSGSSVGLTQPTVQVNFNSEGTKIFSQLTTDNVGREIAIFLDGNIISAPVVQEKITDGTAIISGNFTADSAKQLVSNLNLGALPVPITPVSTESIGATLGNSAAQAGVFAGIVGFIALAVFMILWYRLPGVVSVVSLSIYVVLMIVLFKLIPVVLTAAGIAGFVLSVGLAVDANILIAERMKEELNEGKNAQTAIRDGFKRAWSAIRDSNIAHIIAAVILFWMGTSIIRGFALVFGLGVVVSLLSAITISRTFLLALGINAESRVGRFLMRSGLPIGRGQGLNK